MHIRTGSVPCLSLAMSLASSVTPVERDTYNTTRCVRGTVGMPHQTDRGGAYQNFFVAEHSSSTEVILAAEAAAAGPAFKY